MTTVPQRHAARVLLFDEDGRVLLIHFVVPRGSGSFSFWATPGGEIEAGETAAGAAEREAREELGVALTLTGPVHESVSRFEHQGQLIENIDIFFTAYCAADAPVLDAPTETERAMLQVLRWWTAAELAATSETVFPPGLAGLIGELGRCARQLCGRALPFARLWPPHAA